MQNILLSAAVILGLVACDNNSVSKQTDSDRIKYKETVSFASSETITFQEVTDSRCPENVQCVWAGNVIVDLAINSPKTPGLEPQIVKMCLGECGSLYPKKGFIQSDTATVSYGGANRTLILTDVSPYPNTTKSFEKKDYSIKLEIK